MIKRDAVGVVSPEWPPKRVMFRHADGGYDLGFDNAAEGQFVVNLTGWVDIEVGDGTIKRLGPGSILLAEDPMGMVTTVLVWRQRRAHVCLFHWHPTSNLLFFKENL